MDEAFALSIQVVMEHDQYSDIPVYYLGCVDLSLLLFPRISEFVQCSRPLPYHTWPATLLSDTGLQFTSSVYVQ